MKYASTLLASEPTTQEVRKADLDLLKKINEQADRIDTNSESIISTDETVSALPVVGDNYLINSNFNRWDYATSQTSNGYGSDNRWSNENVGTTKVHSRQTSGDTERALFSSPYYSRTVVTSVAGASNRCTKNQKIEDVTKLAGKTITLSFWAKADASKNIAIEFAQNFGTGGSPSPQVSEIGVQKIGLTTSWQKFTRVISIPSIIGKTLGIDGVQTTATIPIFYFDAGSTFNSRTDSLGQQSGTFDIAEVKFEVGTVATPWCGYNGEFGGEVEACARYYEMVSYGFIFPYGLSGNNAGGSVPVMKKRTGTVVTLVTDAALFSNSNTGAETVFSTTTNQFAVLRAVTGTGAVQFSGKWSVSCEL